MDPEQVARQLGARGVLEPDEAELFGRMTGYRNRLVRFYDEASEEQLHDICTARPEPALEYGFDPTPPEELGG